MTTPGTPRAAARSALDPRDAPSCSNSGRSDITGQAGPTEAKETPEKTAATPATTPAQVAVVQVPAGFTLDELDKKIIELVKQGLGSQRIAVATGVGRTTVQSRRRRLEMAGLLNFQKEPKEGGGGTTQVARAAAGTQPLAVAQSRALTEVATKAGELSVEYVSTWARSGELLCRVFNSEARQDGEMDFFQWVSKMVGFWRTERVGLEMTLAEMGRVQQEHEVLQQRNRILSDEQQFRRELMEYVMLARNARQPRGSSVHVRATLHSCARTGPAARAVTQPPGQSALPAVA